MRLKAKIKIMVRGHQLGHITEDECAENITYMVNRVFQLRSFLAGIFVAAAFYMISTS